MKFKKLHFKMDIENKILFSFLFISILFTSVFAFILFYSGYYSALKSENEVARLTINSIEKEFENLNKYVPEENRKEKIKGIHYRNVDVYDRNENIIIKGSKDINPQDEWVILSYYESNFNYNIKYVISKKVFYDDLIETQKYMILATVALLIITVLASVFISYNISAPLRALSDMCSRISKNPNYEKNIFFDEYGERKDEVGELANSFRRMIKDLKNYNEEILRVKQLNEGIVENLPLGIIAFDAEGNQLCINQKAASLLGKDGYYYNKIPIITIISVLLKTGKVLVDPIKVSDKEGKNIDLELGIWRLSNKENIVWGGLCTLDDITYKKLMEEKYGESEKLACTGKIAADLAHEIRNPLAGIRTSVQVIGKHLQADRDISLCKSIVGEVDRINLLIENLLNIQRARTSQKTLFNLENIFDELSLLYSKVAENSRIELSLVAESNTLIYADESQIKQILINLMNNAIKAMKTGGALKVIAKTIDKTTIITVSNNGIGMTEIELKNVLNSYESAVGMGRGLGISIVKSLLNQNGGRISLKSEAGSGTEVTIIFERGE